MLVRGDQAHQRLRRVGVEWVAHEDPGRRRGFNRLIHGVDGVGRALKFVDRDRRHVVPRDLVGGEVDESNGGLGGVVNGKDVRLLLRDWCVGELRRGLGRCFGSTGPKSTKELQ